MAQTFDASLSTAKDRIRYRLDDATTGAMLLQDETIAGAITNEGGELPALAWLARGLIVRYGKQVTSAQLGDGVGFEWAQRVEVWREVVREVEREIGGGSGTLVLSRVDEGRTEYTDWSDTWEL